MNGYIHINVTCNYCWKDFSAGLVHVKDYEDYMNGELVQKIWPHASTDWREMLIGSRTGHYICNQCWEFEMGDGE